MIVHHYEFSVSATSHDNFYVIHTTKEPEVQQQFCTATTEDRLEQDTATNIPVGALPGSARRHLLWDIDQFPELTVYFLNPDLLDTEKWKCGHAQLTTNNILDWTDAWNEHPNRNYPKIVDRVVSKEEAQIRVLFNSKYIKLRSTQYFFAIALFLNACKFPHSSVSL